LLTSLAVTSLAACGAGADGGAPEGAPEEPTVQTAQALDDPDGLITPDFGSGLLPQSVVDLSKLFGELSGYYSFAKSGLEIAMKAAELLGILDKPDPNAPFNRVVEQVTTVTTSANWADTLRFIDDQRGPAIWAMQRVARAGTVPEGGNEDQSSGSSVSAITGPNSSAFRRPFVATPDHADRDLVTKGVWQVTIADKPKPDGLGLVYDWRLGVPAMLELITIRLMVIGAMDPNFRWNDRYDTELRTLRDNVDAHYKKMVSGIKCFEYWSDGRPLGQSFVCADVYTGIYARDSLLENWSYPNPFPDAGVRARIMERLRSQVLRTMPLFDMKKMVDLLTLYINGTQDLTETNQEIRLAAGSNDFCMDIPWGDPAPLNPLQIYGCHGAAPQAWIYNRQTGEVRNPAVGTCLDVWPPSEQLPQQLRGVNGYVNGATVYSNTCDGGEAQRWTYDTETQVLQNGFGMYLLANAWSPEDHAPLLAYQINSRAEALSEDGRTVGFPKWQAVQKPLGKRDGLLWRRGDGELVVWDTLSGYRQWEHSLGWVDLAWKTVATGDFNGDGHGDIFWRHPYGLLSLWELKDTAVSGYPSETWNAPETPAYPFAGDLDGDRVSDLVWNSTTDPGIEPVTNISTAWLMYPSSTEPRDTWRESSTTAKMVALGNFDGDAADTADMLWLDDNGTIGVELSGGGGWTSFVDPGVWSAKGVGDFNADGTTDVLWYNTSDGRVARGRMYGGQQAPLETIGWVGPRDGWAIQGAADVDHDGVSDIVWRHIEGWVGYWMMNADGSVRDYPTFWLPTDTSFSGVIKLGAPRS
jgi:hypothetical protein